MSPEARNLSPLDLSNLPERAFTILSGVILAVVLHELGHAIACLLLGFRITGFNLFSMVVYRADASWRVTRSRTGGWGSISCYPEGNALLRLRVFLMCAAGPAASIFGGNACLRMAAHSVPGWPEMAAGCLHATGFLSIFFGLSSLVPFSTALARSDGLWMWTALVKVPRTEQQLAEWLLRASSFAGVRPRD
jgi:hypothetical protein